MCNRAPVGIENSVRRFELGHCAQLGVAAGDDGTAVDLRVSVAMLVGLFAVVACGSPGPVSPTRPSAGHASSAVGISVRLGRDWPTYHAEPTRAGLLPDGPDPSGPTVAWHTPLDGAVYASPLVVGGRLLAATEAGSLYALDAATGAVLWRAHLADPVPGSALPCGDIDPVGITGTPVYDPTSGEVFAVALGAGVVHTLFGVDVANGRIAQQRVADAPGSEPGTQLQRGALLLSRGMIYIPYGGNYGDCGQYLGRVVAAPTAGIGPLLDFAVPTTREGGIWAPPGPTALMNGDLLVTTGNGEAVNGEWDHSDSALRLSADLRLRDGFAPVGWAQENSEDADLGSTGPVLLPDGHQLLVAGKGGGIYLLNIDALGGVGGQRAQLTGCESYGGATVRPGPGSTAQAYLPCQSGLLQVLIGPDQLTRGWQAPGTITGSPILVGHTVWSAQPDGTLDALDAADGHLRATLNIGAVSRFATPAASGTALFLPTLDGITAVAIAPKIR